MPAGAEHELQEVTKHYLQGRRVVQAVRGVSLRIEAGEFVSIMGPSGSGKSTLMHLLWRADTPSSGRVLFRGRDLSTFADSDLALLRRTKIGFIFQFFNLLPTLTAVENVALPLLLAGQRRGKALKPAQEVLERVGLSERASHFPDEMSGGEMQRWPSPAPGDRARGGVVRRADRQSRLQYQCRHSAAVHSVPEPGLLGGHGDARRPGRQLRRSRGPHQGRPR